MNLQDLEDAVHENNVEQKTIDLVQDAESNFRGDLKFTKDELGSHIYEIGICLDIYNPSMVKDVEILKNLKCVLEEIYNSMK